jgi:hypothetical protein
VHSCARFGIARMMGRFAGRAFACVHRGIPNREARSGGPTSGPSGKERVSFISFGERRARLEKSFTRLSAPTREGLVAVRFA